jgi:hypothetical protein
MPIIHDNPWLIEQLLKSVAQDTNPAPTSPDNQQQIADAMRALLSNLRNQADPSSRGVIEHGVGAATLGSQNMESMGDFIAWLATNQTKLGGKQIVFPGNTEGHGEDYDYYKIEPGTKVAVEVDTQGGVRPATLPPHSGEVGYWIQTDALKQFLVSLQKDDKLKNNVTFQVQLLNLIRFANEQLDTELSETYKEVLPDATVLDAVPNPIDPYNWGGSGQVILTYADVKSLESLGGWIKNKGISVRKKNQTITSADLQNFQICDVIVALYHRAYSMTRTPDTAKAIDTYKSSIATIAKQSNCNVSVGAGNLEGGQSSTGEQQQVSMSLEQLAELLPFNTNFIDFRQLAAFTSNYANWSGSNQRPEMAQLGVQVQGAITRINGMLNAPGAPIQMGSLDAQRLGLLAKNVNLGPILVRNLYTLISISGRMYQDFMVVFAQAHGGMDGSPVRPLRQQINVQQQNMNDLIRVMNQLGTQQR